MIGQNTVLHYSLGHSAANGSLEEKQMLPVGYSK